VHRHVPDVRQVEGPWGIRGELRAGVLQQYLPSDHFDGAFPYQVDPLDVAAHLDRLDAPRAHGYPLPKPDSPILGFRIVSSAWGRGPRVPHPAPHRHRGRAVVPLDRLCLEGDGVHVVALEVPPEDERYRQCLYHEELIIHSAPPDVDRQRHLRVHLGQLPRGVTHLGPKRRPRCILGPPFGQHIRADHTWLGASFDHRPRGDGGLPRRQLVRRANLKILFP